MSELVKLISAWDTYNQQHKGATAVEFCMNFLATESNGQLFSGLTPPDLDTVFAKLIGRVANMHTVYCKMALQDMPGFELEWFYFLSSIYHLKSVKKTQLIQYNFTEQTTGIDILNKLKKLGYVSEKADPDDKRAKLVSITKAGEKTLFKLYQLLYKPTLLLYHDISQQDKQVVVNLLKRTEQKHQEMLSGARNKSIDELLVQELGSAKITAIAKEQENRITQFSNARKTKEDV
ncbi:DNA-binding transcriptional regulator, MarR family [Chitinophaga jiangningensis]|uniref:DNA-binding transcriptional regulator, MarR family n=1 Tax=Chitinophaga jiangningensis TaxID=1419482 RepID=A0A1M7IQT0_9BACT|nr:winged helix DNA-binding protein [Chitinophaga jiangningensis]SHM43176.1 DNA-binding transcriptional regulator, MarR family [Chitinophaga jiangningensis]